MRAAAADNPAGAVSCGADINWILGNIVFDRDRYNQDRNFGISIAGGRVVFGVSGDGTATAPSAAELDVLDQPWHHIAVQRRRWTATSGSMSDGVSRLRPTDPTATSRIRTPASPVTCCGGAPCDQQRPVSGHRGAEKHDAGASSPRTGAASTRCGCRAPCATPVPRLPGPDGGLLHRRRHGRALSLR